MQAGCNVLDPTHRHERDDYFEKGMSGEKLWIKNQVIVCGRSHHIELDKPLNREYREEIFIKLRGQDELTNDI